eukprot:GHVN01059931.1.p1 GENE.GHVN01059931.1~~GHVN01059931.1.p1  ORF type:complete len:316 (-),score=69.54 GHVN01059931.1:49-996(-)
MSIDTALKRSLISSWFSRRFLELLAMGSQIEQRHFPTPRCLLPLLHFTATPQVKGEGVFSFNRINKTISGPLTADPSVLNMTSRSLLTTAPEGFIKRAMGAVLDGIDQEPRKEDSKRFHEEKVVEGGDRSSLSSTILVFEYGRGEVNDDLGVSAEGTRQSRLPTRSTGIGDLPTHSTGIGDLPTHSHSDTGTGNVDNGSGGAETLSAQSPFQSPRPLDSATLSQNGLAHPLSLLSKLISDAIENDECHMRQTGTPVQAKLRVAVRRRLSDMYGEAQLEVGQNCSPQPFYLNRHKGYTAPDTQKNSAYPSTSLTSF